MGAVVAWAAGAAALHIRTPCKWAASGKAPAATACAAAPCCRALAGLGACGLVAFGPCTSAAPAQSLAGRGTNLGSIANPATKSGSTTNPAPVPAPAPATPAAPKPPPALTAAASEHRPTLFCTGRGSLALPAGSPCAGTVLGMGCWPAGSLCGARGCFAAPACLAPRFDVVACAGAALALGCVSSAGWLTLRAVLAAGCTPERAAGAKAGRSLGARRR